MLGELENFVPDNPDQLNNFGFQRSNVPQELWDEADEIEQEFVSLQPKLKKKLGSISIISQAFEKAVKNAIEENTVSVSEFAKLKKMGKLDARVKMNGALRKILVKLNALKKRIKEIKSDAA